MAPPGIVHPINKIKAKQRFKKELKYYHLVIIQTGLITTPNRIIFIIKTNTMNTTIQQNEKDNGHKKLHIFINKIKYDENDGVKSTMTGGELADLVPVPREVADITRVHPDEKIDINQTIEIHQADHFEIIRKNVQAG